MSCAVTIADPAIEAHHALLEISDDGVELVQLAGRLPVMVATTHLEIGDTRIELVSNGVSDHGPIAHDRSHRSHVRRLVLGVTVETPLGSGSGAPVVLDADSLAIVDDHPEFARARAIVRSLTSQAEVLGITLPAHLITAPGDPALDDYPALLEIGARWRARWTTHEQSIRLHAAGRASRVHEQRGSAFGDLPAFLGSLEPVGELADSVRHVGIA